MNPLRRASSAFSAMGIVDRISKIIALGLNDAAQPGERATAKLRVEEQIVQLRSSLSRLRRERRRGVFGGRVWSDVSVCDGVWHKNNLRSEFNVVTEWSLPPHFYWIET